MGRQQHKFKGAPYRFDVLSMFIGEYFGNDIEYIADVAGGQGVLSKQLAKTYNYHAEVIDPRGWRIKGVPGREEEFDPSIASYYDLILGLHPDEATRPIAEAAHMRPVLVIPCCNFWSDEKLGRDELVEAIEEYYGEHSIKYKRITFPFRGPKNIGILSIPPDSEEEIVSDLIEDILDDIRATFNLE